MRKKSFWGTSFCRGFQPDPKKEFPKGCFLIGNNESKYFPFERGGTHYGHDSRLIIILREVISHL